MAEADRGNQASCRIRRRTFERYVDAYPNSPEQRRPRIDNRHDFAGLHRGGRALAFGRSDSRRHRAGGRVDCNLADGLGPELDPRSLVTQLRLLNP